MSGAQRDLFAPWPLRERVSRRARRARVEVRPDGEVVLTIPRRGSREAALRFLDESHEWIERTRERLARRPPLPGQPRTVSRRALREAALQEGRRLLDEEAARLGLRYADLSVRDTRSRWGSCGRDGGIMLSLRLALAPPEVFRYVAVHELCHLRWHGHGPRFWALVEEQMPDFTRHRAWLREHGPALHQVLLTA